ncbi:MAG: glycosyltransferase family 2 protein [Pseudomonadota bacterium]|nr:glycosyltransferase family 2 protein [Pseudomonadota bacterium]
MIKKISIILSTYNSPDWLEKTIFGFSCQTIKPNEILIADDGSDDATRSRINQLRDETGLNLIHIWQEDNGFRKTLILNKAIIQSTGDYLIFTDGDCIPRDDFVSKHIDKAKPGYFLSGGYFKLPMETSLSINNDQILSGKCFEIEWLKKHGLKATYKSTKLSAQGWRESVFNTLTPTKATWNGHNASGWRSDILKANGFDNRMQYGGEDRELGERLFNSGIKAKQIRYSAICIHLDHDRGYINQEALNRNLQIRNHTRQKRITRTNFGISELTINSEK